MDMEQKDRVSDVLLSFDENWEKLKAEVLSDLPEESREDFMNAMLGLAAFN